MAFGKNQHPDIDEKDYGIIFDYLSGRKISVAKEDVPAIKGLLAERGHKFETLAIRRAYNIAIQIRNLNSDDITDEEAEKLSNGLGSYNVSVATVKKVSDYYQRWKHSQELVMSLPTVTPVVQPQPKTLTKEPPDLNKVLALRAHYDDLHKIGQRFAKDMLSAWFDSENAEEDIGIILVDMQDYEGGELYDEGLLDGLMEHVRTELEFDYMHKKFKDFTRTDLLAFDSIVARHEFDGTCNICKKLKDSMKPS